ncbi:hypothetical protein [Halovivax limisalsi]|uniref:hypothetical protein n=1 Tax=Halovivax limisalsi TaxID=1453760 RepID=UPI001FFD2D09|nr:hypothetical protein [Halovivax limisalsi]
MADADGQAAGVEAPIEAVAAAIDATETVEIARGALACAGATVARRFEPPVQALAGVIVASQRTIGPSVPASRSAAVIGVDESAVSHAVGLIEEKLTPPAPGARRRRLRQTIVAIDELLDAKDRGLENPPRLHGPAFEYADPRVLAMSTESLTELDGTELRAHRRRLEADLEVARLGVELYVHLHGDGPSRDRN